MMGTASEYTLREILSELESHTLPTDAATETTLAACLVALELIDDLRNALASVATDAVRVAPGTDPLTVQAAGGDKLFSFESVVSEAKSNTNLSAGVNTLTGTAVPDGKVWVLTHVSTFYVGTSPTYLELLTRSKGILLILGRKLAPASEEILDWQGVVLMTAGDYVRAAVVGATAGDDMYFYYAGYQMDAPS